MLPNSIRISNKSTEKLRFLKGKTGLNRNTLARIAMTLALNEAGNLSNAGVADYEGQDFTKSLLFGDNEHVYDVMINQYIHDYDIDMSVQRVVAALVEVGVHKMGHLKSIEEVYKLS